MPYVRLRVNADASVKVAFLLLGPSGLLARRAWRFSNDLSTWSTPDVFGATSSGPGDWSWDTSYHTLDVTYQWAEIGLFGRNNSGTIMKSGLARAIIDVRT